MRAPDAPGTCGGWGTGRGCRTTTRMPADASSGRQGRVPNTPRGTRPGGVGGAVPGSGIMSVGWRFRATRSALFAVVCVVLAALGHALMCSARAWLLTIARRTVVDSLRRAASPPPSGRHPGLAVRRGVQPAARRARLRRRHRPDVARRGATGRPPGGVRPDPAPGHSVRRRGPHQRVPRGHHQIPGIASTHNALRDARRQDARSGPLKYGRNPSSRLFGESPSRTTARQPCRPVHYCRR